ncbi:neuronal acetylcholine receptor subunit alpha-6-like [Crassostrea angulata]|uniref:neuronal acetylcholine receptor subunit alpha-6-like n=1 Tax=Magallana angulata TaxID=2784310 RepID=UPI0022B208F1|nr:neuronal acetylcholine receptor subunit alpha-6-like [Crassostrea angulata]
MKNEGVLLILCSFQCVEGYSIKQKAQLHANLSSGYDRMIRPGLNQTVPTIININFYLTSLEEFAMEKSKMTVMGSFGLEWTDSRLTWNSTNFDGDLNQTSLFVSNIWAPYFILFNPHHEQMPILSGEQSCNVYANGKIVCLPSDRFVVICSNSIDFYPFDTQNCTLRFYVPGYLASDIVFQSLSPTIQMDYFEENGQWFVRDTKNYINRNIFNGIKVEVLQLEVIMQRRSKYYVFSFLLPTIYINFLQIFVFILPADSNERVGFSIGVLLCVVIFLTIILDKLPVSPDVSKFMTKLLWDMVFGSLIVLAVVLTSRIYHKEDAVKVPMFMKKILRIKEENTAVHPKKITKSLDKIFLIAFTTAIVLNISLYFIRCKLAGANLSYFSY